MEKRRRKRLLILQTLRHSTAPLTSKRIASLLAEAGHDFSERTVRLYLHELDTEGLTENHGRRGRTLTSAGMSELNAAEVIQRVGFLSSKIDQMTYRMSFDLQRRAGEVVVNTSTVPAQQLYEHIDDVCQVFAKGYAMGDRVGLLPPGARLGDLVVGPGRIGFCTVCSITLNGVLLKHGIPTTSRFGGLLELREGRPRRFVELICYDGTSIDPLEVFIRSGMTDYHGAITSGTGRIGASFRELPTESRELVLNLAEHLKTIGLGGLMRLGQPGQPVLDVPTSEGRVGAIVVGGLNPIAILEESGKRILSRALAGLMEYNSLFHYGELPERLRAFL